jgi:hypothetical protein
MMKMKRKRILVFAGFILLFTAIGAVLFQPYPTIDESKVHPALRGPDDSSKCGWTSFADGGTMVIHIERADGGKVVLCMSNSLDHSFSERGQLYIGAMHFSMPGATKISGYDHTEFVVARLLARDLPKYPGLRENIALMTKRFPDWISFMFEAGPLEVWNALRFP